MNQNYNPLKINEYHSIKVGDVIVRMIAFCLPDQLIVNEVTANRIKAGLWEFDRNTGIEIDEEISVPVSYISRIVTKTSKEK
jgi:hypothetical protein